MGQTYAINWSDTAGPDDSYVVERSTSQDFSRNVEQQQVSASAASYVSTSEGIYYHRVRAVAGCNPANQSANSPPASVTVVPGPPVVVITVHPIAAIIGVGDALETAVSSMTIENIGRSGVVVSIGTETMSAPQFFTVTDPSGGDVTHLLLTSRVPKQLAIHFSGVSSSSAASYQGLISIRAVSAPLAVTPYAFVNLKIGSSGNGVPSFRVAGTDTTFASFPGFPASTPDSGRRPLRVEIVNSGDAPLDVSGEIAPEAWLTPKPGWNTSPIPPKSSIFVDLTTDRSRAFAGSALPRFTYFTVRTRAGASARLTVQDNDVLSQGSGPLPPVSDTTRSFILTRVALVQGTAGIARTRLRLSNVSNQPVVTTIYYIPSTFDASNVAIAHTTVVVPPNDVVALSDALGQLFGFTTTTPTFGQLEIRTPSENAQFLTATAATYVLLSYPGTAAEFVYHIPIILRGEGARTGRPQAISGVAQTAQFRSNFSLVETTRFAAAVATLTFFDKSGVPIGQTTLSLRPAEEVDPALSTLLPAMTTLDGGRIELSVIGSGAVAAVAAVIDNYTGSPAATYVSQPVTPQASSAKMAATAVPSITYTVVGTVNGPIANRNYATLLGISAPQTGAQLTLSYFSAEYASNVAARLNLGPGQTIEIPNVLKQLFQFPESTVSQGTISVVTSAPITLYGRIVDSFAGQPHVAGNVPVISTFSEAITSASAGFQRPVYFDGLEQSIDPTRGSRWSVSLSEINSASAVVTVRLYEPGNRTSPISERDFAVGPREYRSLNTIFAEMGLDTPERRKERTNVQVVVIPKSGYGAVVAVANGFDSSTGDVVRFLLTPNGGVAASGASKTTAIPLPPPPPRRRASRH